MRVSFSSLRVRLVLLVLLAVVPALGLILYTGLEQRRDAAADAEQEALRLARIASTDHQRVIAGMRSLLIALARLPAVRKHDFVACSALFADILRQFPLYTVVAAVKPNGDVFCSGLPQPGPVNIADRPYFQRALHTRDFVASGYLIGRISGKPSLALAYPSVDKSGLVRAVVYAGLDLSWLNQLAAQAQLPQGSVFVAIDRDGTILARHPDPEKWVGKSPAEASIVKTVLAQGEGAVEAPGLDGIPRLFGFVPLYGTRQGAEAYVWIGIPKALALAQVNRTLARNLVGLGLVGILALVAAWVGGGVLILRRVNTLVNASTRLGSGDLASRVEAIGDDELGTLATAFNTMADGLETVNGQLAAQVQELERRQRELSLLREIDQKLMAGMALSDLLRTCVEAFARFAEAPTCALVTADPDSGMLTPVAISAPDPEGVRRYFAEVQQRVGEGVLGMAIATRAAVWSPDTTQNPRWERLQAPLRVLGIRAVLAVPLLTDDKVLGAVGTAYLEPRTFSEAEVQAMEGFASQLAVAWEHARLREEAAERWRLEEANRVKALFIANMSHELRTPLNSVIGFSQLLEEEVYGPLNEKQKRYAANIQQSGKHLLALINDILDLSKVEAGKIELRPEPLLLPEALDAAVTLMRGQAGKKRLTIQLEVEEGLPEIMADPLRLKQILFNLLSNAVKFTPEGGGVSVTARRVHSSQFTVHGAEKPDRGLSTVIRGQRDEYVEIRVQDTGIGIKPEDLGRLFQEFVRLDTALAWRAEGTGLGLALTKRLVELHGGTIWANSEGNGKGSTFTVRLPLGSPG